MRSFHLKSLTVLKDYLPEFKFFSTSKNPTLAQSFKLLKNENECLQLTGRHLSKDVLSPTSNFT